jgi:hypothetical protein
MEGKEGSYNVCVTELWHGEGSHFKGQLKKLGFLFSNNKYEGEGAYYSCSL